MLINLCSRNPGSGISSFLVGRIVKIPLQLNSLITHTEVSVLFFYLLQLVLFLIYRL